MPFPTTRSASSNPFTGSEKVTAIENAPVTGSLAELVMVTVGAAVFAVMENWSAAALEFPELSCAAPAAMSTVTVPETSGVIVAVCKVAGFTAGRGEPRHRATGIVGQLPRVRGQTPGLPPAGRPPDPCGTSRPGEFHWERCVPMPNRVFVNQHRVHAGYTSEACYQLHRCLCGDIGRRPDSGVGGNRKRPVC